ncbi:hypothetical protein [Aurantivibrio infirmus]
MSPLRYSALFLILSSLLACEVADEAKADTATNNMTSLQPAVTVREVMLGVIEPASNNLWAAALEENEPKSNQDWRALEYNAIQIISASSTIAIGGTGPNDYDWAKQLKWQRYAQEMASISEEVLKFARDKKYDELLEASNRLIEPCGSCHSDFPSPL